MASVCNMPNIILYIMSIRTCQNVNSFKPSFLHQKVVFKTKNELISEAYFLDINHLTWSDPIPPDVIPTLPLFSDPNPPPRCDPNPPNPSQIPT